MWGVALTIASCGFCAPLGATATIIAGGVSGAYSATVSSCSDKILYDRETTPGDVLGGAMLAGTLGAIGGKIAHSKYAKAQLENSSISKELMDIAE